MTDLWNRRARPLFASALLAAWLLPGVAGGDIILYRVPGISKVVVLEGKAVVNQGATVSYSHPRFGKLYFDLKDTRIHEVPPLENVFQRRLRGAEGNADEYLDVARWALKHGNLQWFYQAVAKALEADPQHPEANRIRDLKRRINQPLGDWSQQERQLRTVVGNAEMRIEISPHFILLHDTPAEPQAGEESPRAKERLRLLETVYESFLLRFYAGGVDLEIPRERLKVVLFNEHLDFLEFAERLSPSLKSASGFWDGSTNIAFFFDHGTTEDFKLLQSLAADLQKMKTEGAKMKQSQRPLYKIGDRVFPLKDLARMADTVNLLVQLERENNDITVVSHEATHQLAGNTGLLPRHVMVPTWAHEGLATYFESPKDAAWSGIGAVNEERLESYRRLERNRMRASIDFTITDRIFDTAEELEHTLHGYGQSWALTHFLMERHFGQLMAYYRRLG
ncbi:MAG: DUF1570 domain-containing protein, partial [Planctomycetes bacterium]|nr:DUF1570 domain-containing protein [Planctomycetota bacterium]